MQHFQQRPKEPELVLNLVGQNRSTSYIKKADKMKNIDVVDMGGHRSMGRDAARGMVRVAKCTFIRAKRILT